MLERFSPADSAEVSRFARTQPEFDYLQAIICRHTEQHSPGSCWVWRIRGRLAAFCALAFTNPQDAWLYGMRVDDELKGRGIATQLTRSLLHVARDSGRSWVGLDTKNVPAKASVFRICNKLGMCHEGTYATAMFWRLASFLPRPTVRPMSDAFGHLRSMGVPVVLLQRFPLWLWYRPLPERRTELNRQGRKVAGMPALLSYDTASDAEGRRLRWTILNIFDRPADMQSFVRHALGLAGHTSGLVINYPVQWMRELRQAAYAVAPELRPRKNCHFDAWRIYGKTLS